MRPARQPLAPLVSAANARQALRNAQLQAENLVLADFETVVRHAADVARVHGPSKALTYIRAALVQLDRRRAFQKQAVKEEA